MTLSEFKAWFEGFTEDMGGAPTKKQWERIKERVGQITGQAVSYPVYIDRYVQPVRPYWERVWCGGGVGLGNMGMMVTQASGLTRQGYASQSAQDAPYRANGGTVNSTAAMNAVGRADALALKAA